MLDRAHAIDRDSPLPMYFQLKEILLARIRTDGLQPEAPIPSEMELIASYGVSRTTVRQAIAELVKEGTLYTIKGKGTFVAKPKIDLRYMNKIESFAEQVRQSGRVPSTRVLEFAAETATDDVARELGIRPGDSVIKLVRLRCADDEPIVFAKSYHPRPLCDFLFGYDLGAMSLYHVLSFKADTRVYRVKRTVEAMVADKMLGKELQVKPGFPIQHFCTTAYNYFDKPIEFCISDYRGDRNKFSIEIIA